MATQVFELANRAMGGRLPDLLTRWRSERLNRDEIADKLRTEHGIDVSGRTSTGGRETLAKTLREGGWRRD